MSKYIDIGANLTKNQFTDLNLTLTNAEKNNVERIIITGTSVKTSYSALDIVNQYPNYKLYSTAGIHPHDAKSFNKNSSDHLTKLLNNDKVIAVGETGLDYNRMFSTKDDQINCFRSQLELAVKFNKPVFLHDRDAFDDFYNILSEYRGRIRGVVHCFTGTKEQVEKYIELGMYIGITGWICDDRRNKELLRAVKYLTTHTNKIMVETDSPFLSPVKGKNNEPANTKFVMDRLARELNIKPDELSKICYENTIRFFNI